MQNVRTRFAPSPTGYMHIGGMRTALFNWLWARHTGGQFILRIDDTDQERNVDEALTPILDAFRWLKLDWDEGPDVGGEHGPYFQSQRSEKYQAAVDRLLADGKAYRDFDPPEVVQAERQAAEKEKRTYLNARRSLDLSEEQIQQHLDENTPHVIRFLIPRDETIAIDDVVRGHVEWDCSLIADPVIVRGNGSPLYNFATVIDDADMQISHVIRAEEHLTNTSVQALICKALGYTLPTFAHLPYVAAPGTKEKLSKRDKKIEKYRKNPQFKKMFEAADVIFPQVGLGTSESLNPVMVEYYEKIGYLPDAVFNALARLGWSLDDKTEIMSRETIIENFTLKRVIKSPAGLDPDKLASYQLHWMGQLSLEDKVAGCILYLVKAGWIDPQPDDHSRSFLSRLITALEDRLKVFSDILDYREYFVSNEELTFDEKAFNKRVRKEGTSDLLLKFRERLSVANSFEPDAIDRLMHDFVEAEEIKMGEIIHAVRVAVTGKSAGPGMFDCMSLLGRERCLARIDRALKML